MHTARDIAEPPRPEAQVLAAEALRQALVIVAGAGISKANPSDLPDGSEVARRLAEKLSVDVPPEIEGNLLRIADLVEADPGGHDRLQQALPTVADFTGEDWNFGHRALALLVSEAAIELLITNWDDCVERADTGSPSIQAVVNDRDAQEVTPPRLYKLHGCARRSNSLLVSSSDLADPPTWAMDHLRSRLATAVVVFLGIGDVPEYVQRRLEQLREEVDRSGQAVWVAARSVAPIWDKLLPQLLDDHKLVTTADDFLDEVLRAYVRQLLDVVSDMAANAMAAGDMPVDLRGGFAELIATIEHHAAEWLLCWAHEAAVAWPPDQPKLNSPQGRSMLLALAAVSELGSIEAGDEPQFKLNGQRVHALMCSDETPMSAIVKQAEKRVHAAAMMGDLGPGGESFVLHAGAVGSTPAPAVLRDISSSSDEDANADLIEASTVPVMRFLNAAEMATGHMPNLEEAA